MVLDGTDVAPMVEGFRMAQARPEHNPANRCGTGEREATWISARQVFVCTGEVLPLVVVCVCVCSPAA